MPKKVVYILVFCLMILSMTSVYDILGTSLGYLGFLLSERTSGFSAIISLNKFPSKILLKFFNVNSFLLSVTSHAKCPGAIFPPPIICHFLAVNGSKFYKNMKNLMSPEVSHTNIFQKEDLTQSVLSFYHFITEMPLPSQHSADKFAVQQCEEQCTVALVVV